MCKRKPVDAVWQPVPEKKKPLRLALNQAARSACMYGALNLVLFWWQQAGYLVDKAAEPAMWVCGVLAGVHVGLALKGAQ